MMVQAAVVMSIEEVGMLRTMSALLAVLKMLSEDAPWEFALIELMHQECGRA